MWEARSNLEDGATMARLKKYMLEEVDEEQSTLPMAGYCFMTGIMCVLDFFSFTYLTLYFIQ